MLLYATFACKHFMPWLYASLIVRAFGTPGVVEMVTVSAFELHDVLIGSANAGTRRTGGCALCTVGLCCGFILLYARPAFVCAPRKQTNT